LRFLDDELEYLRGLRFIRRAALFRLFKLKRRFVTVSVPIWGRLLIIEGPMIRAMFFEIVLHWLSLMREKLLLQSVI
jgi:nicotinate phosphoribosyltransferase